MILTINHTSCVKNGMIKSVAMIPIENHFNSVVCTAPVASTSLNHKKIENVKNAPTSMIVKIYHNIHDTFMRMPLFSI